MMFDGILFDLEHPTQSHAETEIERERAEGKASLVWKFLQG